MPLPGNVVARQALAAVALAAAAGALGFGVAHEPRIALAVGAAAAAWLTLVSAEFRLLAVIGGAALVLESTPGLSPVKAAYAGLLGLATVVAAHTCLAERRKTGRRALYDTVSAASCLMALAIVAASAVGLSRGANASILIRDALPYALLAVAPLLALDFAHRLDAAFLRTTLVVAGVVITVVTARRVSAEHYAAPNPLEGVDRSVFASVVFGGVVFAYTLAQAARPSSELTAAARAGWLAVAGAIVVLMLVSGTRATVLLALPIVVVAIARFGWRAVRWMPVAVAAVALVTAAAFGIARAVGVGADRLDRLELVVDAVRSPGADSSLQDRFTQSDITWSRFRDQPALGVGLGHVFRWTAPGGHPREQFRVDSSVSTLAKFGTVGGLSIIGFLVAIALALRRFGAPTERLAAVGAATWLLAYGVLTNVFEDKGLALSLLLLLALALHDTLREPGTDRTLPLSS